MTLIPVRELRNHTADVLARVRDGDDVTITVNGVPVADLVPTRARRASLSRRALLKMLEHPTDRGLHGDLAVLAADTTDDLGPIR